VIEALGILRARGERVVVIATGETSDYRSPGHFEALMRRCRELGVLECFRPLGVVPYMHVAGLMRDAHAVINPSRFEGWSTTVEEAKSLGKQVLLSEIDVHIEQSPPGGVFFDPNRPEELADAMWRSLSTLQPDDSRHLAEAARRALPARRLEFARTYERIIREAVAAASP